MTETEESTGEDSGDSGDSYEDDEPEAEKEKP